MHDHLRESAIKKNLEQKMFAPAEYFFDIIIFEQNLLIFGVKSKKSPDGKFHLLWGFSICEKSIPMDQRVT